MHDAWLRSITVVLAVAVVIGCDSFLLSRVVGDRDAVDQLETPTPGGGIELVRASDSTLELRWPAARDNATSQDDLEYRVVWSNTNNIATPADAPVNGTTSLEWSPNVTSHTIDDLSAQTDHWVSVLVRDAAGGTAMYGTVRVVTAADATAPDLPNDTVSIVSTDVNQVQLSWASADDRETAASDLAYRVVYTQNASPLRPRSDSVRDRRRRCVCAGGMDRRHHHLHDRRTGGVHELHGGGGGARRTRQSQCLPEHVGRHGA